MCLSLRELLLTSVTFVYRFGFRPQRYRFRVEQNNQFRRQKLKRFSEIKIRFVVYCDIPTRLPWGPTETEESNVSGHLVVILVLLGNRTSSRCSRRFLNVDASRSPWQRKVSPMVFCDIFYYVQHI